MTRAAEWLVAVVSCLAVALGGWLVVTTARAGAARRRRDSTPANGAELTAQHEARELEAITSSSEARRAEVLEVATVTDDDERSNDLAALLNRRTDNRGGYRPSRGPTRPAPPPSGSKVRR